MAKVAIIGALIGLAALGLVAAHKRGGEAWEPAAAQTGTSATPLARRPASFGIVLATPATWIMERSFANVATGGTWKSATSSGWTDMPLSRIEQYGAPGSLEKDEAGVLTLAVPAGSHTRDLAFRCTFQGHGSASIFDGANAFPGKNRVDFTWPKGKAPALVLNATDPADPARNFDCRERDVAPDVQFDATFLASNKPYSAIRYLDWMRTNENLPVTWATRSKPDIAQQVGPDGIAVEHLVALANTLKADPWFTMPWNADADYYRRFATYVHDHLDPGLVAYVETGNEIWNLGFPAARQALSEGQQRNLGGDDNVVRMRRYAEHSVEVLDIFADAFKDNPKRLVRVMSGQSDWVELLPNALDYKDTPKHLDAIAIAPYFGAPLLEKPETPTANLDPLFQRLNGYLDQSINNIRRNKAIADHYGLRLLAYEAGQHVTYGGPDETVVIRLNRDPRMKQAYERYMNAWATNAGDLMMMFGSISPMGRNSGWGLQEYSGQPLAETQKLQAVLEMIGRTPGQKGRLQQ